MTKVIKSLVIASSSILGAGVVATAIAVPIVLSNTDNNQQAKPNVVITLNDQYLATEKKSLSNNDAQLPVIDALNPAASFSALVNNANEAIKALNNLKNTQKSTLNENEIIWIDSYITQWEIKKGNLEAGTIFLGANPINGDQILSSSSNHIRKYVSDAINIYPLNPETGDPDKNAAPDEKLINNVITKIMQASAIVDEYKVLLQMGAEQYGYMPSTIQKKLVLNQLISYFYSDYIDAFGTSTSTSINLNNLLNQVNVNDFFQQVYTEIMSVAKPGFDQQTLNYALEQLNISLKNFIIYYGGGSYYGSANSYGPTVSAQVTLTKTNGANQEVEKVLTTNKNVPIYGLGISQQDLQTNDIGIGYMKIKTSTIFPYIKNTGNEVYQQLLYNNNSINSTAQEIYTKGIELSKSGTINMKELTKQAKSIIIGNLTNDIMYDSDGIGPIAASLTSLTGDDFTKFNKWLNQESFFWGRETFAQTSDKQAFIDTYWNNASGDLAKYKKIIIEQGYEKHWLNASTINNQSTGTVEGNLALAGAVLSLSDYIQFQKSTSQLFDQSFNPISDYVISPYNYNIRQDIGVGMEGPRGSQQFQYNCDPYYSLPKWSVSSLTTHEGKMGHHTQQQYWTEYLQGGAGLNASGPGYTFTNVAFHEGWAVFTEWYANELEIYGTNLDATTHMPQNWSTAKGLAPNWDAANEGNLTAQMKTLHGGVYYENAIGSGATKTENAIKLANMLQYYGYLNETQLRNMRLALDTAIHFKGTGASDTSLPYGTSIKQVRDFMDNNSALSIGDINSESFRYAVMPSQATGYMLGKIVFQNIYDIVQKQTGSSLVDNKEITRKLFDLMLRNGEIPLQVLKSLFITN